MNKERAIMMITGRLLETCARVIPPGSTRITKRQKAEIDMCIHQLKSTLMEGLQVEGVERRKRNIPVLWENRSIN